MSRFLTRGLAVSLVAVLAAACVGTRSGPASPAVVELVTAAPVAPVVSPTLTPTPPPTSPPTATPTLAAGAPTSSGVALSSPTAAATFLVYDPSADARADIQAALALARTDGHPVLIDFGADWCPDCWVLYGYLESAEGKAKIGRYAHIVRVDVGGFDRNLDLVKEYGNLIWNGIPAVVALGPDGSVLGSSAHGALANAGQMSKAQVLGYLAQWFH